MKNVISKISMVFLAAGLIGVGIQACGDESSDKPAAMEPSRGQKGNGDQRAATPTPKPTLNPTAAPTATPTAAPTGTPGTEPTIAPPHPELTPTATSLPEPTALSQAFARRCAGCHGADGDSGFAPKLGAAGRPISLEEYITTVRSGRGSMPAFADPSRISDADLANDHRYFELKRR